ncbi:Fibroblast growth factor receptor 4 [Desmophyllum pertusum]|uniref:Fibroblast growth factor receptor 4 n=1 Tax=Desmophyllum pertusum TaxID=174260 RepID=A0A9W9Y9P6_9CNID|nr:Fibroblast growth factor receptor 4 [Desmophyllum pertusum]
MKEVEPTDSGKYTCNVSNAYGWINHTYVVDVHDKQEVQSVFTGAHNYLTSRCALRDN